MLGWFPNNPQSLTSLFKWPMVLFELIAACATIMLTVPHFQRTHQLRVGDSQYGGPLRSGSNAYRSTVGVQLLRILPVRAGFPCLLSQHPFLIEMKSPFLHRCLRSAIRIASRTSRNSVSMAEKLVRKTQHSRKPSLWSHQTMYLCVRLRAWSNNA